MLLQFIQKLPEGYSEGTYNAMKYGLTKTTFNNGKSFKIYGEELGGKDYISLNYYITEEKEILKPCEMSKQKVILFLQHVHLHK